MAEVNEVQKLIDNIANSKAFKGIGGGKISAIFSSRTVQSHIENQGDISSIFQLIQNEQFSSADNNAECDFKEITCTKKVLLENIVKYIKLRFTQINNYLANNNTTVIKDDNELIKLLNLYPGDIAIVEEMFKFKNELINNEEYKKLIEEYKKFSKLIFEKKLTDGKLGEEDNIFKRKMEEEDNLAWNLGLVLASNNNGIDNKDNTFGQTYEMAIDIIKMDATKYKDIDVYKEQAQNILIK